MLCINLIVNFVSSRQASANGDDEGMGIDYEYSQALSELRVDLNAVD